MLRSLPKSACILALFLAVPILCLAWTAEPRPVSGEFDDKPGLDDSLRNRGGAPFHNGPETATNIPAGAQKAAPVVSTPKPLYLPNVARDRKDSQTAKTGIASLFSFLLPSKENLDKFFKAEDDGFRDRGRSASNPLKKRDWK